MKKRISPLPFLIVLGAFTQGLVAQEPSVTAPAPTVSATVSGQVAVDPAKLPYGVTDVVKLSRAQVNEEVIVTYIQNSGTAYNLGPSEILYLRDQGVSDRVLNVMLDQRRKVAESLAQTPAPSAAPQQQPAYQQPAYSDTGAGAYAQTAPYVPSSSVYTIPYAPTYSYYSGYPYSYYPYYGYYGYGYPYFSVGFYGGYYGGHYGHGYYGHGGHYGGGHYGGGGIHVGHGGGGGGHGGGGGGHGGHR